MVQMKSRKRLKTADPGMLRIRDSFWDRYTKLVTEEVLPYQWKVLNDELEDVEPSHAIRNFRIAAGRETGDFYGFVFQDSDVAKWLEAAAYALSQNRDPSLEEKADRVIRLIGEAQRPDGYLDTYFMIRDQGELFSNLRDGHELYCAGHLIEAGCAYYKAVGKSELLEICRKLADHIVEMFHTEELARGIPGHEEIELALVKLYETTGEKRYLQMAKEFLDRRGTQPNYFFPRSREEKMEADPLRSWQKGMIRHMLRQMSRCGSRRLPEDMPYGLYIFTARWQTSPIIQDEQLLETCRQLWENITGKQMYVTGSIGSSGYLERFTTDYDLPNAMNYSESCASIGLALFARRMAQITHDGKYMDTAECALYNTVLAGIAQDGKSFFYVNPLAVWPHACMKSVSRSHVKSVRQKWFACACCPPNIARTLASLGEYCIFTDEEGFWVNLFVEGEADISTGSGDYTVQTRTRFPFGDTWEMKLTGIRGRKDKGLSPVTIRLRIPGYVQGEEISFITEGKKFSVRVEKVDLSAEAGERMPENIRVRIESGYAIVEGCFSEGDCIQLHFEMPPVFLRANRNVRADAGRVCLKKGPLVYCLEQEDNGENLEQLIVDAHEPVTEKYEAGLLGGTLLLTASGYAGITGKSGGKQLYSTEEVCYEPRKLTFVPYAYWGNRNPGEMIVWVRERILLQ